MEFLHIFHSQGKLVSSMAPTWLTNPQESLAFLFEAMGLYEDTLTQYDELENLFFQVSREKNMTWFGTFISPIPKDDSVPLLSLSKKAYRDLILANTITVFDLRVYMLARQCLTLGMMGRVLDVCQKTSTFLSMFGQRLREAQVCEDHSEFCLYI
jgi:trafficking protein particle complex subunit 10